MFIGRNREIAELEARWKSGKFELGVIYGARRIGKTSLLRAFIDGKNAFFFQARRTTEGENLKAFSREFFAFLGNKAHYSFDSFESAFDELSEYAKKERFVFVIDEVPYLCSRDKHFLSTLQYYVDGKFRDSGVMLLLSGSNISFMEELLNDGGDPLYKRATFQMNVLKMPFSEALSFLKDVPDEEKLKYLAVFGSFPYYLGMVDSSKTFEENLRQLLFNQYGTLVDAPDKVLPSGLSEQGMYNAILTAVASSKRSVKEIADSVGRESNYTAKYLSSLVGSQVLEKRESFVKNKKLNYYEFSDSLLRFWYRFIFNNREEILFGLGDSVYRGLSGQIELFLSQAIEDVVILYMTEQNQKGNLGRFYRPIRNYRVENSALGRSIELDGLAEEIGGKKPKALLVVECKYRNVPFSMKMFEHLKESVSVLGEYDPIDYWLFSKTGFDENLSENGNEHIHMMSLPDMLVDK